MEALIRDRDAREKKACGKSFSEWLMAFGNGFSTVGPYRVTVELYSRGVSAMVQRDAEAKTRTLHWLRVVHLGIHSWDFLVFPTCRPSMLSQTGKASGSFAVGSCWLV